MEGDRRPGPPPYPSRVAAIVNAFAEEADSRESAVKDLLEGLSKR